MGQKGMKVLISGSRGPFTDRAWLYQGKTSGTGSTRDIPAKPLGFKTSVGGRLLRRGEGVHQQTREGRKKKGALRGGTRVSPKRPKKI